MINVTKAFLPPFEEYEKILKKAWNKGWITNNGELVQELETKLKDYLMVKHLFFCSNGTVVLQMALKVLGITKEVITTPFSYVATLNAILWEGCKPIFVDIKPDTFCIDENKIEFAITENTEAILATHVYGFPCNVSVIEKIAQKHNLKVIYDGAHAFGCSYEGRSLLNYGDISTCSFHATKLFHTVEGGAIITNDDKIANQLMLYRQFGHVGDDYFSIGINAKNSEFHAAMGLAVIPSIETLIDSRKKIVERYITELTFLDIALPKLSDINFKWNYSYFPILFATEPELLHAKGQLEKNNIFTRRYFYPSLNTLFFVQYRNCSASEDISKRILCLPLYHDLMPDEQLIICDILKKL